MSLGNVLGAAAPIAAGYFSGGASGALGGTFGSYAPIAAGALTGAGIAALSGDDPLMGAVSGGLGGYGGGSMATAAQSAKAAAQGAMTDAAANKLVQDQALKQAGTGITSGIQGPTGQLGANMNQTISQSGRAFPNIETQGASQGATIGQAYKPDFMATTTENFKVGTPEFGTDYGFSDVITQLGEGDTTKGAIKTGLSALPVAAAAFEPEYESFDEQMSKDKYDPSSQLNLSMDTGIDEALSRDTGLRLLANGGYLDGGMLPGDGMSDDVPAMIDGSQQAALSQGEFVIPADVVSHLGNGSSDAGSKRLYNMMDKIRKARTGTEKQGKEINPERFMPR